jgi:membrane-bound lytic murein transglycosylase D
MVTTAKGVGLNVNSQVDERRDPYRSSEKAAVYFKQLYDTYHDWSLAIAAYNCGPGNVNKAIRRAGTDNPDFWEIYNYLPRETRGYVPAFIAANYVMNYYCDHNICPMLTHLPEHTDTIEVNRNISLNTIARFCDIDLDMLRDLNPQYRRDIVPGATKPSAIRLPVADVARFIDMQDSIFSVNSATDKRLVVEVEEDVVKPAKADRRSNKGAQWHTIKRGDTIGGLARKYRTTASKIRKLNGLRNNNIRAGQKLRVR